jgi:hypothetical protein
MTRKTTTSTKSSEKKGKRLSVSKRTLKDLSVSSDAAKGVKGGRAAYTKASVCADQCC